MVCRCFASISFVVMFLLVFLLSFHFCHCLNELAAAFNYCLVKLSSVSSCDVCWTFQIILGLWSFCLVGLVWRFVLIKPLHSKASVETNLSDFIHLLLCVCVWLLVLVGWALFCFLPSVGHLCMMMLVKGSDRTQTAKENLTLKPQNVVTTIKINW